MTKFAIKKNTKIWNFCLSAKIKTKNSSIVAKKKKKVLQKNPNKVRDVHGKNTKLCSQVKENLSMRHTVWLGGKLGL